MITDIVQGLIIPFIGTSLGAASVFFMKNKIQPNVQRGLIGFAAGVMVAASVWSLLIPAMDQAEGLGMGKLSFLPALIGFWLGMLFLLFLDKMVPHEHVDGEEEGPKSDLPKSSKLVLAVVLHNIPEGMAVGVVYASWYLGLSDVTLAAAVALSIGMAIQNVPEGAIISMPLLASGSSRKKSFGYGVLSGAVEPISAVLTILAASLVIPILPYLLSFAAGAMVYVVVEELIPGMSKGDRKSVV